jgi:hypothetical protein
MLGNSIALLTLALMLASEGKRSAPPWQYGLFTVATIVALIAFALRPITDLLPSVGTTLSAIFGNPLAWFILLMGAFFVTRPFWLPKQSATSERALPVYGSSDLELEERIDGVETTLREATTNLSGAIRSVDQRLEGVREYFGGVEGTTLKKLEKIEALLSLDRDYARQQVASLYEALGAIYSRERLMILAQGIEDLAKELDAPTINRATYTADNWVDWQATHSLWKRTLREWCDLARCYVDGVDGIDDIHHDQLQQKGKAKVEQFPDTEAFIEYKTFWIMLKQWRDFRAEAERAVINAAYNGGTTSSRSLNARKST